MTVRHSNYAPLTRSGDEDSLSMSFSEGKKQGRMRRARMAGRLSVMCLGCRLLDGATLAARKDVAGEKIEDGKMMKDDE